MRMGLMFSGIFWGALLILFGVLVILKAVFGINLPIFRILFAIFLIYLGIKVLVGEPWPRHEKNVTMFEEGNIDANAEASNEYSVVFGRSIIDLSGIAVTDKTKSVKVNTVFGDAVIKINPEAPVKVVINSAFAGARTPDGNIISFGKYKYTTKAYKETLPCLLVEADVVFGGLEVVNK